MDHPALLWFVKITIFALMLAIGVNHSLQQLISLWRRPGLLMRALLAVIVLVPALVALLLWQLPLSAAVATGLALLAVCPGAPLTTERSGMAASSIPHAASLQLTLALLAVLSTPVTLAIFHELFELETENVAITEVARQVATVQFLPVCIGLLIQRLTPKLAESIGRPVTVIANGLFFLLVAVALVPGVKMILQVGGPPTAAIVVMVLVSLTIGHLLGGPVAHERSALAIASIARNIGLALFIATLSGVETHVIPTLLSYMILGALIAVPYSIWRKRHVDGSSAV